jgi:hypothetical protein
MLPPGGRNWQLISPHYQSPYGPNQEHQNVLKTAEIFLHFNESLDFKIFFIGVIHITEQYASM